MQDEGTLDGGELGHLKGTERESCSRLGDSLVVSVFPATIRTSPRLDLGLPHPRQVLELLQTVEKASF